MTSSTLFNVERDKEIEKAGGFWCFSCLIAYEKEEQSEDPRYCKGCKNFLLKEVEVLPEEKRLGEKPNPQKSKTVKKGGEESRQNSPQTNQEGVLKGDTIPGNSGLPCIEDNKNKSTLKGEKSKVGIIQPTPAATLLKRGPKKLDLPEVEIRQLAFEGMGPKAISTRLKNEHGVVVSYKTIQRRLGGKEKCQS